MVIPRSPGPSGARLRNCLPAAVLQQLAGRATTRSAKYLIGRALFDEHNLDRSGAHPVAGAVAHFQRAMMMDVDQAAKAMRDEEMQAEIEDFIEGFNQPTYRGMRINGVRVATWSSRDGWSGDRRPEAEWLQ
jgi:hypothetical protein